MPNAAEAGNEVTCVCNTIGQLTRGPSDLGNSVWDETAHVSTIPQGCPLTEILKCNIQKIPRKMDLKFFLRLQKIGIQ